jgi:phosphomannomutase/phosphoglucomutase
MNVNPAIFRAYDIRGRVEKDLDPQVVEAVGKAYGTHIKSLGGKKIALAQDNRRSSSYLAKDFSRGVLSTGIDILDIGLATTPMLYFAVITRNLSGGAVVTGSHSKDDYNGIKLCRNNALHIFGEELQELKELVVHETFSSGSGRLKKIDIYNDYEADILSKVKLQKSLKIAIDCGDGTTGAYAAHIFRQLGCKVVTYACELESDFPHGSSNPEDSKNLFDLSKVVRENNADAGLAFDSDGDRLGAVDERGDYIPVEAIAAILSKQILATTLRQKIFGGPKKKFICDVKSLLGFTNLITKWGGEVEMVPTGRTLFRQLLYDQPQIQLGVEGSGHVYLNDRFYGYDDGIYAAARLLEILAKNDVLPERGGSGFPSFSQLYTSASWRMLGSSPTTERRGIRRIEKNKRSLSTLARIFPPSFYTPVIEPYCPDNKKFQIVDRVSGKFEEEYDTIDIDGVRIRFDKQSWGLVRASETGPRLSLRFEAPTRERLVEIDEIIRVELKKYPEVGDWQLRLNK